MTTKPEMTSFEKELYDIANKIVGHVAPVKPFNKDDPNDNSVSVTGEPYLEFYFTEDSFEGIRSRWHGLLNAYLFVVENMNTTRIMQQSGGTRKIYWRTLPDLTDMERKKVKVGGLTKMQLYARFLISANN